MAVSIEARNYRGTRDFLRPESDLRQSVTQMMIGVFERFGFEPLETPVVELRGTLLGKYGNEGNNLTYFFQKGGEEIGLRYDHTVPLSRVVAQHLHEIVIPYRRYAVGPVFRADTPQKGRYRQFTQCDYDIIGVAGPVADAEVITVSYSVLRQLGFEEFEIQICDRNLLEGMARSIGATTKDQVLAVLRGWDKIEKATREQVTGELSEAGASVGTIESFNRATDRLLEIRGTNEEILATVKSLFPSSLETEKGIKTLSEMNRYIDAFGIPREYFKINPTLARGLDYYTGPIFETVVKKAGVESITGGGRFDNLIKSLGGPQTPGTGSSFGLERVITVMEQLKITPKDLPSIEVFVTVFDPQDQHTVEQSIRLVSQVREMGYQAEMYMGDGKLGKQFQLADRRKCQLVLVVGPDEEKQGLVTMKDLKVSRGGEKTNQIQVKDHELQSVLVHRLRKSAQ